MYNPWTTHFKIMSAKLSKNASFLFLFSTLIRFLKIPKRDLRFCGVFGLNVGEVLNLADVEMHRFNS